MGRVFYFGDKSPVVNPDEYLSLSGEVDRIICLSLRDIHVINSYLWPYTEWRTRFSRPFSPGRRIESTSEEFVEYQLGLSDLSERIGEASMASCSDGLMAIASALQSLATNASSAGCCDNSGSAGAGQHSPPFDNVDIQNPGEGPPPTGFDSWEQYEANKCAVATDILRTMIGDVARMGTLNLAGATVVSLVPVLAGLLLDPVPGDELVLIAGVLLTVLAAGYTVIDFISDILVNHESEFICVLFEATSPESAKSSFLALFSDLWVEDGGNSVTAISAGSLVGSLLGATVVNKLFTLETARTLPEGDCSGCGVPLLELYWYNNADSTEVLIEQTWGEEVEITSPVASNGFYYSFIKIMGESGNDPDMFSFSVAEFDGYSNNGSCPSQGNSVGVYGPENWDDQGFFSWRFGCQNTGPLTIRGTFNRSI